jgi:hypothetical protein
MAVRTNALASNKDISSIVIQFIAGVNWLDYLVLGFPFVPTEPALAMGAKLPGPRPYVSTTVLDRGTVAHFTNDLKSSGVDTLSPKTRLLSQ